MSESSPPCLFIEETYTCCDRVKSHWLHASSDPHTDDGDKCTEKELVSRTITERCCSKECCDNAIARTVKNYHEVPKYRELLKLNPKGGEDYKVKWKDTLAYELGTRLKYWDRSAKERKALADTAAALVLVNDEIEKQDKHHEKTCRRDENGNPVTQIGDREPII